MRHPVYLKSDAEHRICNRNITWKVSGDTRDTHDRALGGRVAPGFVVAGENAQMAAPYEFLVVQSE